jgi:uncharacterized protein YutE (UPF0331/DUF86 family)
MIEKDAILSKISIVQNCLKMIQKATLLDSSKLDDLVIQDVFVLNVQRAVQASIDMAHLIIAEKGLKLPANYKEAFSILEKASLISNQTARKMEKMVGFRNIAVHDYRALDLNILKSILSKHLKDFEEYYEQIYKLVN